MEKELGTHSESESLSQILLRPLYLSMLLGLVVAGTFVAAAMLI